jgi:hypothetical protein
VIRAVQRPGERIQEILAAWLLPDVDQIEAGGGTNLQPQLNRSTLHAHAALSMVSAASGNIKSLAS